jgi:hypothetical protein
VDVKTERIQMRRLTGLLVVGASALMLAVGLSLLLSRAQASAQAGPPNSQIRSPDRDAIITQKDSLTISGIAWEDGVEPPYLVEDPELSFERMGDRTYYVNWTAVASATQYIVEEATRPDFDGASSEIVNAPETSLLVAKDASANGTYYYRVQAFRSGLEPSRYSNVESVVVPWTTGVTALSTEDLSADVAATAALTVQVAIDGGDWYTAIVTATDGWGGWEWSYDWDLPEEDDVQHAIKSRASVAEGVYGPEDTITVTLSNASTGLVMYFPLVFRRWPPIPYAPTLNDIPDPGSDGSYTVSWSYPYAEPPVTTYTLQESKDSTSNFVDVYNGTGTSYTITKDEGGTFYYRVRGNNSWGAGEWSAIKSIGFFSYFDDFSNYQSGWPREWEKTRGALYQVRPYEHPKCPGSSCEYDEGDGYVIARRSGSKPYARFGPEVAVPSGDYEIEVDVRWWDAAYFATYQILFGSDRDFDNYYALQVRINIVGDSRDCDYSVIRHTSSALAEDGTLSVEGDTYKQGWTGSSDIHCNIGSKKSSSSFDHWKIRRENDEITVWVNGKKLGEWEDSKFGANRYFGVGATLYEGFTPSKPEFDNWSVVLR